MQGVIKSSKTPINRRFLAYMASKIDNDTHNGNVGVEIGSFPKDGGEAVSGTYWMQMKPEMHEGMH